MPGSIIRARTIPLLSLALLCATGRVLVAQGWNMSLFVQPFPSPYTSDWETNQQISNLRITNPAATPQDVRIAYQITNTQGRILASGASDPLGIPPGAPTVMTSILDIAGASRRDEGLWSQMERTGRIPEGTYTGCATMAAANCLVLGEDCQTFTIVYPDAPQLIAPGSGESLTDLAPIFQWTPVVVPAAYPVQYALQIAEVLAGQTSEESLNSTIVHYQAPSLTVTNLQYPADAQPFERGKRYAWRVVVIDESGFPPTANGGLSEIRTFLYDASSGMRTPISLTLHNEFDEAPAGDEPPASIDIAQLCSVFRDPISAVTISSASPIGLKRFAGQPAVLYRDSVATKWQIATNNPKGSRAVLVGGDCDGTKTRMRWIASKDSALQRKVSDILRNTGSVPTAAGPIPLPDSIPFGMVVLSLAKETVAAPPGFTEAEEFLGERELEVAPGLNFMTVLSLQDWGLWWLFQWMGFGEKEIEVSGFLGWNASWHIGGAVGEEAGVDVSLERKFLVLTAAFPKRTPQLELFKNLFQSSQLAFEFSIGDSTGLGTGSGMKSSFDVVGKLIHTIQLNDELAIVGQLGLDLARETSLPIGADLLSRWDWLRGKRQARADTLERRGGTFNEWRAAHMRPGGLEDPEVNLDVVVGYAFDGRLQSLWRGDTSTVRLDGLSFDAKIRPSEKKVTFAASGTLAIGSVASVIKIGASKEFEFDTAKKATPDTVALKKQIEQLDKTMETKSQDGSPLPDCFVSANKDVEMCKTLKARLKAQKDLDEVRNPETSWRARVSAGQMSIPELVDLIKGWTRR